MALSCFKVRKLRTPHSQTLYFFSFFRLFVSFVLACDDRVAAVVVVVVVVLLVAVATAAADAAPTTVQIENVEGSEKENASGTKGFR